MYQVDWATKPEDSNHETPVLDVTELDDCHLAEDTEQQSEQRPKPRPNYFFCIRITSPEIQSYHKVRRLECHISNKELPYWNWVSIKSANVWFLIRLRIKKAYAEILSWKISSYWIIFALQKFFSPCYFNSFATSGNWAINAVEEKRPHANMLEKSPLEESILGLLKSRLQN